MKKWYSLPLLCLIMIPVVSMNAKGYRQRINLSGEWQFALGDTYPTKFDETVMLPGTTDTNKKGIKNTSTTETTHLTRLYHYKGKAWYSRIVDIPKGWEHKLIRLRLERTKPSTVCGRLADLVIKLHFHTPRIPFRWVPNTREAYIDHHG